MAVKDRIKSLQRVWAGDLVPNPRNWRTHPDGQIKAVSAVLDEIGYADALRGHPIYHDGRQWRFRDTGEPTATTWKIRPCGHCGRHDTPCGHDGCVGELPNTMNACCGHGDKGASYIQFSDGITIHGSAACYAMGIYRDESSIQDLDLIPRLATQ